MSDVSSKTEKLLATKLQSNAAAKELIQTIESGSNPVAAAVAAIASPATADAEDCALKINELIAALKAAGLMA